MRCASFVDMDDTRLLLHHDQKNNPADTVYARGPSTFDGDRYRAGDIDISRPQNAARFVTYQEFRNQCFAVNSIATLAGAALQPLSASSDLTAVVTSGKRGKQATVQKSLDRLVRRDTRLAAATEEMLEAFRAFQEAQGEPAPAINNWTSRRLKTIIDTHNGAIGEADVAAQAALTQMLDAKRKASKTTKREDHAKKRKSPPTPRQFTQPSPAS